MMGGYKVGLAGESNYQGAISRCRVGEPARILHEQGNPYDDRALVVVSRCGERIGYVPKSNWLRDAIHEEGKGCTATVRSVDRAGGGQMGVVIDVELDNDGVDCCQHGEPVDGGAQPTGGLWGRLFGGGE